MALLLLFGSLLSATFGQEDLALEIQKASPYADSKSIVLDVAVTRLGKPYRAKTFDATAFKATEQLEQELLPLQIGSVRFIDNQEEGSANYRIETLSGKPYYTGDPDREITLLLRLEGDSLQAQVSLEHIGSLVSPIDFRGALIQLSTIDLLLMGVLALALLLLIISELPALWRLWQFNRKYVKPYGRVRIPNRQETNPITLQPFRDNDMVVTKCKQKALAATWQRRGYRCPNYPDCPLTAYGCHGKGFLKDPPKLFFTQQGSYRLLNWLWFGAGGGFLAWLLFLALKSANFTDNQTTQKLIENAFFGFSLGLGLTAMLSWVEERGQSRRLSWTRILLRALGTSLLTSLVFVGGFYLEKNIGLYVGGLLTWLLFGLGLGWALSFYSTISWQRGLLAGVIAGVLAFQVYFVLVKSLESQSELALLVSLILLGALAGMVIVSVVRRLEDFELEVLSPTQFSGQKAPISKWLKADMNITIGTDQGCHVLVKWGDQDAEAQARHAELSMRQQQVFITPHAETWLGGYQLPIGTSHPLSSGDIIRLGRESISRFRYHEKRKK
jgi:hypothetical protein